MSSSGFSPSRSTRVQPGSLIEPGSRGHLPTLITDKSRHDSITTDFSSAEFGLFCDEMDSGEHSPFDIIMDIIEARQDSDIRVSPIQGDSATFSQEFVDLLKNKDLLDIVNSLRGLYDLWNADCSSSRNLVTLDSVLHVILNTVYYARTCSMFSDPPRSNPPPVMTELYHMNAVDNANLGGDLLRQQGTFQLERIGSWRDSDL